MEDYLTFTYQGRIVEFAAMSRLPAIYGLREFVDAGGLMSYGTDRRARALGLSIPPALLLRADYIVQ